MRAVAAGYDVVGYDVDEHRSKALAAGTSFVEDITDAEVAAALATGSLPRRRRRLDGRRALRRRRHHGAHPAAGGHPRPHLHRRGRRPARPAPHRAAPRWCSRAPPTPAPPRSASRPILEAGLGPHGRRRLPPRLLARAHRPRQPDLHARRTRRRWSAASTPPASPRSQGFYDQIVDTTVPVSLAQGGGAHQAAREHLPAREHRAGQRAGHVRRRPRHRRVGGHRRRLHQAVRLHALHARARASGATASRSTPATCRWQVKRRLGQSFRFVELANDVNEHMPDYVVRRLFSALNDQGKADQGQPHPAARRLVQGQRRRLAGEPEPPGGRAARRPRRRPAWPPTRTWPPTASRRARRRWSAPPRSSAAADAVVLLVDHAAFDPDAIVAHARYVLDTKAHLPPRRERRAPLGAGRAQVCDGLPATVLWCGRPADPTSPFDGRSPSDRARRRDRQAWLSTCSSPSRRCWS